MVTCEIKLFKIIMKLFQCFISHVTSLRLKWNYFSYWKSSEIISKLFHRNWTCWKIFI